MPERHYTNRRYLDALQKRVLISDGPKGTGLQQQNLTAADFGGEQYFGCNDYLVVTCPQAVEKVHRSYLDVGSDIIITCTFRANKLTLAEYKLSEQTYNINFSAAQLARHVADSYSTPDWPRFVGGSIGPSGKLPSMDDPQLSDVDFDDLVDVFRDQAIGLARGGVDFIIIETSQDILEVKACITGVQAAFEETGISLPIQVQVTLDTSGRMLLGTDIHAVQTILEGLPIDVIGLNCSTGPEHMREPIQLLGEGTTLPVSCSPNAGLPMNVDGQAVYPLEPEPFATDLLEFVEKYHINVVGGCCGTTPEHIRLLAQKVHGFKAPHRPDNIEPSLASSISAVSMQQEPRPFLIGERLNTQGSRNFKKLLLAEDFDRIADLAREQMDGGAHGLDICTALTERPDEKQLMQKVVKCLSTTVRAPFIIDSTEPDVIEIALKTAPGKCLINSTNLESGRAKADRIFGMGRKYNAAVIALTIDETGMAKTAQRKLEITKRLYEIAVTEYGFKPGDLVIDALTFTLATGQAEFDRSAIETIEGIKLIKRELPGVLTSLGVSNASFGLAPNCRPVLNSVMLYHCVQAGLDMAIVNPAQIIPYPEIPAEQIGYCEDLIFNRRPDALQRLIEYFASTGATSTKEAAANPMEQMNAAERLHWKILHRLKEDVERDIDELILDLPQEKRNLEAVRVLNEVLLPAMKDVGDKFGSGELILPFVLQSAEVMKKCVNHLENYLEKQEGSRKGLLVLATVYGDVHDIGKNLVKTILVNNGYDVIDLGKQVPAETIIQKAIEVKADAIGLSALLVSTSKQMPLIVNELHRRGLSFPVIVGGAAINQKFGRRILQTEDGAYYAGGVYYCKDAFEGLTAMDRLSDPEKKQGFYKRIRSEAETEIFNLSQTKSPTIPGVSTNRVPAAEVIPTPPDWDTHFVETMPIHRVAGHLAKRDLYRLSWGAKNLHGAEWEKLEVEYNQRVEHMLKSAEKEGWLKPQGVYGYFPCQADGTELIVYDPAQLKKGKNVEVERFTFPRTRTEEQICLADYFAPVSSGQMDVVALQVVTVGQAATDRFDRLQEEGDYSEAYYTHGMAVQMAEAAAEYLHQHIRKELGMTPAQGKRYSWGYPAIPDLADHARVFKLLPVTQKLGMTLTSAYQLVPEQSTAAIIVHHPRARYFSTGETRIEQLTR
jgi:5-methyltetrahydrofolate--homocysteine methyltransferase